MKFCSRCKLEKSKSEFSKHSRSPDGLNSQCKQCRNQTCQESLNRHRDHRRLYLHTRYHSNKRERLKLIKRRWKERHPDEVRLHKRISQRRRQTRMIGTITAKQWKQILLFYGRACAICHIPESEVPLTIDHFIPISKGGNNYWYNVWPLCLSCNSKKRDKMPTESQPPHVAVMRRTGTFD